VSPTCTNGRILRGNECVKPGITGSKKPKVAVVIPTPTVLGTSTTSTTTPVVKYIFVTTMQIGSQSAEVTELQKRLTAEGLYTAQITGYFGILTQAAVKAYQILHGIDPVGIVGPLTRAALNK
jgi:peptidoglycan hydrolase-like protein with peptidoglycan-binding domain